MNGSTSKIKKTDLKLVGGENSARNLTPTTSNSNMATRTTDCGEGATTTTTTATTTCCLVPLQPVVKDYAWGIRGMDSRVGRYALETGSVDEIDPDTPYAELWIGTHDKGPAIIPGSNGDKPRTLKDAIGHDLPFLLKVLSAGKALSIQAHPDKEGAMKLHSENPVAYADSNHKPEMAIALTPFEAMCGFRRLEEISLLLKKHPEFANCISQEAKLSVFLASDFESRKNALQALFESFMSCDSKISERNLKLLLIRLQAEQSSFHPHPHDEPAWERKCARAILRLAQQFPNDPGAMSPLFLNYLLIAPGESFFMAANEPHAYVAGEIIECMACSDNVVRAGLTPKFKDVPNLVNMLTYSTGGPSVDAGAPCGGDSRVLRYTPPVPEFEVLVITIDPGDVLNLKNPNHPAVMIILEGRGSIGDSTNNSNNQKHDNDNNDNHIFVRPGQCYYWPKGSPPLNIFVKETRRGPLKLAMAHKNCHIHSPTAVNRDDFGMSGNASFHSQSNHAVPSSPMPYLGLGTPQQHIKLKTNSFDKMMTAANTNNNGHTTTTTTTTETTNEFTTKTTVNVTNDIPKDKCIPDIHDDTTTNNKEEVDDDLKQLLDKHLLPSLG